MDIFCHYHLCLLLVLFAFFFVLTARLLVNFNISASSLVLLVTFDHFSISMWSEVGGPVM
jgi:hypothetical protein